MSEMVPPPAVEPMGMPEPASRPRLRWPLPPGASNNRRLVIVLVAVGLLAALGLGYVAVASIVNPPRPPGSEPAGTPSGWCFAVNGVPVACDAPVMLEVKDRVISVQGVATTDGLWHYYDAEHEDFASWVQGTVVNYVLGLGTSERNNALFNDIDSGTSLTVRVVMCLVLL